MSYVVSIYVPRRGVRRHKNEDIKCHQYSKAYTTNFILKGNANGQKCKTGLNSQDSMQHPTRAQTDPIHQIMLYRSSRTRTPLHKSVIHDTVFENPRMPRNIVKWDSLFGVKHKQLPGISS